MIKLEIERKYLLNDLPVIPEGIQSVVKKIVQYYNPTDGFRYRRESYFDQESNEKKLFFYRTKKKEVQPGVYEENESIVDLETFINGYNGSDRVVSKRRIEFDSYLTEDGSCVKWFIDSLESGVQLAEVEMPSVETKFTVPDFIQRCIIKEVTGDKKYTNRSLAVPVSFDDASKDNFGNALKDNLDA